MKSNSTLLAAAGFWLAVSTSGQAISYYAAAVLADSPVGYWRLGDTSGSTAFATVGSNGTYQGSPTLGQTGAITVDGAGNLAVGIQPANLAYVSTTVTIPTSFTVEMWINSNTPTWNSYWGVASRTNSGFFLNGYQGGTNVYFELLGPNLFTDYGAVGFTAPAIMGWHHYAATYDATTNDAVVYYDGQPVATNTNILNATRAATTLTMQWGAESAYGRYGDGALDELAIYGAVLSAERIQAHYQSAIPEPAHLLLGTIGFLGLSLRRTRQGL